jgi:hypothetical protein
MKLEVVTDIVSFLGLRGPFDEGEERLKKFKLTKIYDSYTFDQKEAFEYLESRRSNSKSNNDIDQDSYNDIDQDSVHNEL